MTYRLTDLRLNRCWDDQDIQGDDYLRKQVIICPGGRKPRSYYHVTPSPCPSCNDNTPTQIYTTIFGAVRNESCITFGSGGPYGLVDELQVEYLNQTIPLCLKTWNSQYYLWQATIYCPVSIRLFWFSDCTNYRYSFAETELFLNIAIEPGSPYRVRFEAVWGNTGASESYLFDYTMIGTGSTFPCMGEHGPSLIAFQRHTTGAQLAWSGNALEL